jgi:hypothetical protein
MGRTPAAPFGDQPVKDAGETWRRDLKARGLHILGSALGDRDAATTVRVRYGERLLSGAPFIGSNDFIAGIDVVSCADRQQAIRLAAAHPIAPSHAIEVRPFYRE